MKDVLPYIALAVSLFTAALALFRPRDERFRKVETDVALLKWQVDFFLKEMSKNAVKPLHSPHTAELDALIERFTSDDEGQRLSEEEMGRFRAMLRQIVNDEGEGPVRRKLAGDTLIMIHVLDRKRMLAEMEKHRQQVKERRQQNQRGILGLKHR